MEAIDTLTIVNILMTCGIVATLIAIRQIGKENKALHEQNVQQRQKWLGLFEQLFPKDKWSHSLVDVLGKAQQS